MSTRPVRQVVRARKPGLHSVLNRDEREQEQAAREVLNELELYLRLARDEVERLRRL